MPSSKLSGYFIDNVCPVWLLINNDIQFELMKCDKSRKRGGFTMAKKSLKVINLMLCIVKLYCTFVLDKNLLCLINLAEFFSYYPLT